MKNEVFEHRKEIGQRLFEYLRNHGYSKASFAKLAKISRPTLDLILEGTIPSQTTYEKHLEKILQAIGKTTVDTFLQDQSAPDDVAAFVQDEKFISVFSDRAPNNFERDGVTQKIFTALEDVYHLCELYIGKETNLIKDNFTWEFKNFCTQKETQPTQQDEDFTYQKIITRNNLDAIVRSNQMIREELDEYVKAFQEQFNSYSRQSPEKVAFEFLKRSNVLQVPIPDKYFGGAIRKLKNGVRIPVINTAQPRLYQYFVYWHELYHLLFDPSLQEQHHEISIELETTERKADYFAALMLMKNEVYDYYLSLTEKDFYRKIALCMDAYKAPYKAVLIQLYETAYEEKDFETMQFVKEYFDRKLGTEEWVRLFEEMGLDTALLLPSKTLSWGGLQRQIEQELQNNPDVSAHQHNLEFLVELTEDVRNHRPDMVLQVDGQLIVIEVKSLTSADQSEFPIVSRRMTQKDEETWEVELKIDKMSN